MKYRQGDKRIIVQGDPTLERRVVGPEALKKIDEVATCFLVWELGLCETHTSSPKCSGLTEKQKQQMGGLLEQHDVVFTELEGLPPSRETVHQIHLKEGIGPINVRPYRYPHVMKDEIEQQVSEMLRSGVIRPSHSLYSSPVILVKKKDGSWRFCIDYRALNRATVSDKFPIPVIEELLDELGGASYFSKVDLKAGYHQIRMAEKDIEKTAFRTHQGHYEFVVMPFGLTNAPTTFQSTMNHLFKPYLRKFVLVFFDDILVYSRTWEEHLEHVGKVLSTLRRDQWVANRRKCEFGQTQVKYLGHIISHKGVEMDDEKIKAVVDWERPKSVKSVRGFLGLSGYYRRFIRDYGKIARPLTDLLKKGGFTWNEKAEEAWQTLKTVVTTAPVLSLPNFQQPFHIKCDASGKGVGAVLMQGKKPIAFFSKALSEGALSKSIYEKELMALVLAIQHWRPYLLGQRFIVHTDQRSLRYLLEQRITTHNQQNWIAKLLGYDFEIIYKVGTTNRVADALSRRDEGVNDEDKELSVIARPYWQDFEEVMKEVVEDEKLRKVIEEIEVDPNSHPAYTIEHGRLHYKGRLVLSAQSSWLPRLMAEFHLTQMGGHSGVYRTYRRIAQSLFWVGMKKDITEFVAKCLVCQQHKYLASSPQGLLQPLPIPNAIWEELSMDFVVRLPKSQGYDAILVVVDRLSKYAHFIPLKHPYSARTVAEIFLREVVRLHGIPKSIVTDRDPLFLSMFWNELFKGQGTQLKMSTAYHPETDGQTEVVNRVLEGYLRCFCSEQPKGWMTVLSWAEFWYNTCYQGAIRCTPFEAVYGRAPPSLHRFIPGESLVEAVNQELQTRDEALKQLKFHLERAQDLMVRQANKKRRVANVAVGDWVYLKIRPHRQSSMPTRLHPKLSARYFGPFRIIQMVGEAACKLQLPETARIHPVFHVSQVKKALGEHQVERELPPDLQAEGPSFWPMKILGRRQRTEEGRSVQPVLVEWQQGGPEGATLEDEITIKEQYPDFNLGDKIVNGYLPVEEGYASGCCLYKPFTVNTIDFFQSFCVSWSESEN
ncbi:transposon Ty3-G Gag-Pol polyprotein [Vigna angularis]|uniref:transposon Ty3-G Gag-Pol polyprotein n=1 Tax=Phaseolus angularis TaxID=3914 RepID=UPI0022B57F94|nr:transposon Ty3-G Gag-Pol polyprotein [Vigna angularis]